MSRLQNRMNQSDHALVRAGSERWTTSTVGNIAYSVATRLTVIRLAKENLEDLFRELGNDLKERRIEVKCRIDDPGSCFSLTNRELPFLLIAGFNSFLFEMRATYELTVEFVGRFLSDVIQKPGVPKGKMRKRELHDLLVSEVTKRDARTEWINELRDNRGEFIHTITAWPAVMIHSIDPLRAEVMLLRGEDTGREDLSCYLSTTSVRDIYTGFRSTFTAVEKWLTCEIEEAEKAL